MGNQLLAPRCHLEEEPRSGTSPRAPPPSRRRSASPSAARSASPCSQQLRGVRYHLAVTQNSDVPWPSMPLRNGGRRLGRAHGPYKPTSHRPRTSRTATSTLKDRAPSHSTP